MYSLLTSLAEYKNMIFLLLFLKESTNKILASNEVFFVCDIFISVLKKYHAGGPQNEKSSWSGLTLILKPLM